MSQKSINHFQVELIIQHVKATTIIKNISPIFFPLFGILLEFSINLKPWGECLENDLFANLNVLALARFSLDQSMVLNLLSEHNRHDPTLWHRPQPPCIYLAIIQCHICMI